MDTEENKVGNAALFEDISKIETTEITVEEEKKSNRNSTMNGSFKAPKRSGTIQPQKLANPFTI